jgi:hypothetical protein
MVTDMFRIPKLAETAEGEVVVTHWGQAGGTLFRVGDRLVCEQRGQGELLILRPKGWGNPMFGRRDQGQLIAVPSGAPAAACRWNVFGAVNAVERDLERGGVGPGRWYCAFRIESLDLAARANAKQKYKNQWLNSEELDVLCRAAAVAPEVDGVAVAIAAADTIEMATSMVADVSVGRFQFELRPMVQDDLGRGVVVPGPWTQIRSTVRHWAEIEPAGVRVAPRRRVASGGSARVQLSLFGDTATLDG